MVFSDLYKLSLREGFVIHFFQIAETDKQRISLNDIDLRYHSYPYELMFRGAYDSIPKARLVLKLFISVWRSDADLVLLPGYHKLEFWIMLMATILKGKKRAVFCDSTIFDQPQTFIKGLFKRLFFYSCHGFFAYGERAKSYLVAYGVQPQKVYKRCQAAALPFNYTPARAFQQRIQLGPAPSAPRFLYVGRLSPEKSLELMLRAFWKVKETLPCVILVLVGSGPQRQELEDLSRFLGLSESVFFMGSMDSDALADEYSRASCLVLPSYSEPWGLVVNEALSYGCPVVVSSRCGCVPELVVNRSTGFVFESGNADELAKVLLAVPTAFADVELTARYCIDLISTFTPEAAAEEIFNGCKQILATN
ncbi:MAG: glycosyltransferase family 4 protein [Glaciimonas sp.]|nr:glycosyltransferase family 4 protein [Glaciimonas sp.]